MIDHCETYPISTAVNTVAECGKVTLISDADIYTYSPFLYIVYAYMPSILMPTVRVPIYSMVWSIPIRWS